MFPGSLHEASRASGVSLPGKGVPRPWGRIMASWFAGLRPLAGARAACELPADAVVSLRMADGGEASFPLRRVQGRLKSFAQSRKSKSANHGTLSRALPEIVHLPGNQATESYSTTTKRPAHGVQVHAIPTGL
jgi:hypothetical protein